MLAAAARGLRPWMFALLALASPGCDDGDDDSSDGRAKVAVSIFPLYDIARRVAGDRMEVVLVLPPGRSEHGYEPTPREMGAVSGSQLGVLVGLEMDPWAERIVRSAAGEDVELLRLGPEVDPRRLSAPEVGVDVMEHAHEHHEHGGAHDDEDGEHDEGDGDGAHHDEDGDHDGENHEGAHDEGDEHHGEHHDGEHHDGEDHDGEDHDGEHDEGEHDEGGEHHDEHEGGDHDGEAAGGHHHHHSHGSHDPHFWLDPLRMVDAVDVLVTALSRIDPEGAAGFRERGDAVQEQLRALHRQITERSRRWESHTLVTFHGSFGYFAERYGLRVAAVIEPFPGREPTPRYMQEVIGAIRASGARALFSEPQLDPRPARVIAAQAGVPVHALDPVGGTGGVDTYERLLLHNADVLDEALGRSE